MQRLESPPQLRDLGEKGERLFDRHIKHVGNRLALEAHLKRLLVVPPSSADFAGHVDVGEKVHLDLEGAVAATGFAAAALDVEREAALLVAARLGVGRVGVQLADVVEQSGVRGGIRARGAADRRLIDRNHLVEVLDPFHRLVRAGAPARLEEVLLH